MSLKEKLLDLFFPPRCAFCRRTGVHGVCADCERTDRKSTRLNSSHQ